MEKENLDVSSEVKYIDITPTWSAVWKIYAQVYANGDTFAGRKDAESELTRMAAFADKWVEHCKKEKSLIQDSVYNFTKDEQKTTPDKKS